MTIDFRELFRYERSGEVRIYGLRVLSPGVELWRVTETHGQQSTSIKEDDLKSADDAVQALEDIERSLTAGGWRKLCDE